MGSILNLAPVLLFLIALLAISAHILRASKASRQKDFA